MPDQVVVAFDALIESSVARRELDRGGRTLTRLEAGKGPNTVVLLTATKGRPADSTAQVLAIQDKVVAEANGRHLVVPDAGHYIHVDRPDLVIECIRHLHP